MCCSKTVGVLAVLLGVGFVGAVYMGGITDHCSGCCSGQAASSVQESSCCSEQATSTCCDQVKVGSCCDQKAEPTVAAAAEKAPVKVEETAVPTDK